MKFPPKSSSSTIEFRRKVESFSVKILLSSEIYWEPKNKETDFNPSVPSS
jgi:hypothetical protein